MCIISGYTKKKPVAAASGKSSIFLVLETGLSATHHPTRDIIIVVIIHVGE
jgi:hypothetical protein